MASWPSGPLGSGARLRLSSNTRAGAGGTTQVVEGPNLAAMDIFVFSFWGSRCGLGRPKALPATRKKMHAIFGARLCAFPALPSLPFPFLPSWVPCADRAYEYEYLVPPAVNPIELSNPCNCHCLSIYGVPKTQPRSDFRHNGKRGLGGYGQGRNEGVRNLLASTSSEVVRRLGG